ncbi:ABC transporter ATP-binding protein [Streptomyces bluensis]|uniref:ABC transporter ATP-binding protein n=1 Tax=Streptomyces bluensis TaxID=33897 RepID=UPI00167C0310|nr:ABC transporter ATP-binding protein [Streptomyces bluensis]GGZ52431.1 ABC transporter ATP-binding protein [Streptomyces bluensis]
MSETVLRVPSGAPVRPVPAPPAGRPAVRLTRVSKWFGTAGRQTVLEDVSLTVRRGEFLCVLGASGCGKSTLLNLVAGLDRPSAGDIDVSGGRRPALMFQEHALFPWLTAGRNIELALRLRGVPRRERREEALRLLELVRLKGAYGKRIHELSGGMRQRVALARALAQDGDVLLMDEPFAALDAITRDVLHEELARIWSERGLSVVFVTHNVREAVRLGRRVVLLSSRPGRIVGEWSAGDAPEAALTATITDALRKEIRRHGRR